VIPIFKSGNRKLVGNYRPISLLPILNKILEKLIYSRLIDFLNHCQIISDCQFGFRKSKDTQQAALKLIDRILQSVVANEYCACIFLDFSKAFATVDHVLLLKKLDRYGIRGIPLELLSSYLRDRKQHTKINSCSSQNLNMTVGVPQGSCLAPLLYILYTNELHNLLPEMFMVLFVNDTSLVDSDSNIENLFFKLNSILETLLDWCNYNKLTLNRKKTKYMVFNRSKINIPSLNLGNVQLERVSEFKYLGFTLDDRLSHKAHLQNLTSRLCSLKYFTYKFGNLMSENASRSYYFGMVQSLLSYGILV
jgi:hypothetical protein